MTFAELKSALEKLTPQQLDQSVEVWSKDRPIYGIEFRQHNEQMFARADNGDDETPIITESEYEKKTAEEKDEWLGYSFAGHPHFIEGGL